MNSTTNYTQYLQEMSKRDHARTMNYARCLGHVQGSVFGTITTLTEVIEDEKLDPRTVERLQWVIRMLQEACEDTQHPEKYEEGRKERMKQPL